MIIPTKYVMCLFFTSFSWYMLHIFFIHLSFYCTIGGGEIAQSLESLSIKQAAWVRTRLDPLVTEGWNSITVLLTLSHQCR